MGARGSLGPASTGPSEAAAPPALVETHSRAGCGRGAQRPFPVDPFHRPVFLIVRGQVLGGQTPHSRGCGVCWSPSPSAGSFLGASGVVCVLATPSGEGHCLVPKEDAKVTSVPWRSVLALLLHRTKTARLGAPLLFCGFIGTCGLV